MSATGLDVFDKTIQTTNIWLDEIMDVIGPPRSTAWRVLGATVHALRDRLTVDQAAHLGAQLPLLIRGLYYDQWRPAAMPSRERNIDEFLAHVADGLHDTRPVNVREAVETVFRVLARHIAKGQADKVAGELPAEIRALWPSKTEGAAATERVGAELERAG
jgi:uncharacterized protein (DUF2267 family)